MPPQISDRSQSQLPKLDDVSGERGPIYQICSAMGHSHEDNGSDMLEEGAIML